MSGTGVMTPHAFIKKWKRANLSERQTAHEHFLDICALLNHPTPTQDDPSGDHFAFEKGANKIGGGKGFADVWKKDYFAWEYKRKDGDLDKALLQLIRYAPALESPPLHVVCDLNNFEIHTAWNNTLPKTYKFTLDQLAEPEQFNLLRNVFFDPEKLRPTKSREGLTKEAADKFSEIAHRLRDRGSSEDVAHFVNQLVFCFFAQSTKLLPDGLFAKLLRRASQRPDQAQKYLNQLFTAMETGGDFDLNDIAWFNGGLFDGRRAFRLDDGDVGLLVAAGSMDWSQIDPIIFGTLFERFLDPYKRAQIGAHYTDGEKISKIIEPVILRPLREEWAAAKKKIQGLLSKSIKPPMRVKPKRPMKPVEAAEEVRSRFLERLRNICILDPACGSGNFLYLALQGVKDIENRANLECEMLGLEPRLPAVGPEILRGIEISPLAAELARTTIWIGDIQWRLRNGIYAKPEPILRKLDAIECRDALLTKKESQRNVRFVEAQWPQADFIVGNPPFLGGKLMRTSLGSSYIDCLFEIYSDRVPREADLVMYWFEKAAKCISEQKTLRAGLVATNSIRQGANRKILERFPDGVALFTAYSDEPWVLDGAAVRVSLICFGRRQKKESLTLDGQVVAQINADLTARRDDLTTAARLRENANVAFMGDTKGGPFDIPGSLAREWLLLPNNPNAKSNREVLRPWLNGLDVTRRPNDNWIIDFGWTMPEREAALYEAPFQYALKHIKPARINNRREHYAKFWWRHVEPRPGMWRALGSLKRYIATVVVAKHRIFTWVSAGSLPDHRLILFAREDDVAFGILHSRFHEIWSLAKGSTLEDRPAYTPTTTFETFPFPDGMTPNVASEAYISESRAEAIAGAARELNDLRNQWLNPADLVNIVPEVVPGYPDRVLPKNAAAEAELANRTLTKLYNQRPHWLSDAHRKLDAAVANAYGWGANMSDEDVLSELLRLNLLRKEQSALALDMHKAVEDEYGERAAPSIIPH